MVSPEPSGRQAAVTVAGRRVAPKAPAAAQAKEPGAAPLDRMQEALPRPLRAIPLPAVLATAGIAIVGVLVPVMVLVRNDKVIAALEEEASVDGGQAGGRSQGAGTASATAKAEPPRLSAAELEQARTSGTDALAALARRFPDDPGVLQALGTALARDRKDPPGALRALRHLLEVAPETRNDREVQQALIELANGPSDVALEVFDLLRGKMGSAGPDLLFDLAQNATGKYAKEHAAAALDDPTTMKAASRALLAADELRRHAPCARKSSVPKAAAEGDARSVPFLRQMIATKPCGGLTAFFRGSDCAAYTCFSPQERTSISAAIAAIEKRDPSAVAKPTSQPGHPEPKGSSSAAVATARPSSAPSAPPGTGAGLH